MNKHKKNSPSEKNYQEMLAKSVNKKDSQWKPILKWKIMSRIFLAFVLPSNVFSEKQHYFWHNIYHAHITTTIPCVRMIRA